MFSYIEVRVYVFFALGDAAMWEITQPLDTAENGLLEQVLVFEKQTGRGVSVA